MEILTKKSLVGAETAPTAMSRTSSLSKENLVFLLRIHFSHLESDGRSSIRRWGHGSSRDPEILASPADA